jgi:cell division septation protein DedD
MHLPVHCEYNWFPVFESTRKPGTGSYQWPRIIFHAHEIPPPRRPAASGRRHCHACLPAPDFRACRRRCTRKGSRPFQSATSPPPTRCGNPWPNTATRTRSSRSPRFIIMASVYPSTALGEINPADHPALTVTNPPEPPSSEETRQTARSESVELTRTEGPSSAETSRSARSPNATVCEDWLASQAPDAYTLQLMSTTHPEDIDELTSEYALSGFVVCRYTHQGQTRHALLIGAYTDVESASAAAANVPAALKAGTPWIRRFKDLTRIVVGSRRQDRSFCFFSSPTKRGSYNGLAAPGRSGKSGVSSSSNQYAWISEWRRWINASAGVRDTLTTLAPRLNKPYASDAAELIP